MTQPATDRLHLLVVEDDPGMQRVLRDFMEGHAIEVDVVTNIKQMLAQVEVRRYSLVILDLRLGDENGLDALRTLRAQSDLPVIITTGHRRDEIDRVVGLELGADDYVTKPFSLRELLARIRVVLRRAEGAPAAVAAREPAGSRSRFGGWTLDRRARRLTDPDGAPVSLTKGENALLLAFLDAPRRPLAREYLLQATRIHEDIYDRSIDVQILRLRRKLEADPSAPKMILTERGVGYVFALPVETI